jgi:hypothetical protein
MPPSSDARGDDVKRWQRHLVRAMLLLVGGAVVNVAVAWCLAMSDVDYERGGGSVQCGDWKWSGMSGCAFGSYWFQSAWIKEASDSFTYAHGAKREELVPDWSPIGMEPTPWWHESAAGAREFNLVTAQGWPCLSMYGWLRWRNRGVVVEERLAGIEVAWRPRAGRMLNVIPTHPIWAGFAINTIFYAAILAGGWMLFAAPGMIRRRKRIKRGLCPACAYPVGPGGTSAVCTECGTPVIRLWS